MEPVVAHFILYIENDKHGAGQSETQAKYIDEGIYLAAPEIPEGSGEIVFEHTGWWELLILYFESTDMPASQMHVNQIFKRLL